MHKIVFILLASFLLSGCTPNPSLYEYVMGTEFLDEGNYPSAIAHLEIAVQIEPGRSHNHNNLATAYVGLGDLERAWYHSRQAVLCPENNPSAYTNFWLIYNQFVTQRNTDKLGTPLSEVLKQLGSPDFIKAENESVAYLTYGLCTMEFQNGLLSKLSAESNKREYQPN